MLNLVILCKLFLSLLVQMFVKFIRGLYGAFFFFLNCFVPSDGQQMDTELQGSELCSLASPPWIHVLQPTVNVPDVFYKPHKSPPLVFTVI